ncbi:MAG: hypothetical protein J6K28_00580 [Alistipes sp.]|nr:hypothetical protein [Alistipes sp.]
MNVLQHPRITNSLKFIGGGDFNVPASRRINHTEFIFLFENALIDNTFKAAKSLHIMKTRFSYPYLAPQVRVIELSLERGCAASLENPVVDPEQEW